MSVPRRVAVINSGELPKRLAGEGNAELPFNLITWLPQSLLPSFLPSSLFFLFSVCLVAFAPPPPKRSSLLHHKAGCCAKSSPRQHIGCYCRGAVARAPPRPAHGVGALVNRKEKKRDAGTVGFHSNEIQAGGASGGGGVARARESNTIETV